MGNARNGVGGLTSRRHVVKPVIAQILNGGRFGARWDVDSARYAAMGMAPRGAAEPAVRVGVGQLG
jgi:hypothetical protein